MLYNTLKFLHILLAILAVGFSMTFGLILSRAEKADKDGRELKFALQTVRFMSMIANVCFVLLVIVGVGLVQLGGFTWAPMWIHGSAGLFLIASTARTAASYSMMEVPKPGRSGWMVSDLGLMRYAPKPTSHSRTG